MQIHELRTKPGIALLIGIAVFVAQNLGLFQILVYAAQFFYPADLWIIQASMYFLAGIGSLYLLKKRWKKRGAQK